MDETVTRVIAKREIDRLAYIQPGTFCFEMCELLKEAVKNHFNICNKLFPYVIFHAYPDDTLANGECIILMQRPRILPCYDKVKFSPWFRKAKGLKVVQQYVKPAMFSSGATRIELLLDDETQAEFDAERQRIHDYYMTHQCLSD